MYGAALAQLLVWNRDVDCGSVRHPPVGARVQRDVETRRELSVPKGRVQGAAGGWTGGQVCPLVNSNPFPKGKTAMYSNKNEENRLVAKARRAARRVGLRVCKSRGRVYIPNLDDFGELMLVDPMTNAVVAGARFDLSAEEVIEICSRI